MFLSIHHVGIAVHDLDAAVADHEERTGARLHVRRALPEQGVEAAALVLPAGGEVELLTPLPPGEGPVGRFLERRGEGIHHVAYAVPDIQAALERCRQQGLRLVDETPRPGLHGSPVAFLHPAGMYGVLTELVEL